jgi:hypothetical protein
MQHGVLHSCRANTPSVKLAGLQAALAVMAAPMLATETFMSADLQHGALQ